MAVCGGCGAANSDVARFCEQCGSGLTRACPSCGAAASSPTARFCPNCGAPLADGGAAEQLSAGAAAVVAERRVCSVLFADLVGFTPLSEARDPEEVRELLSRYFEVTRTVIARYGGTVEKFIGDAVMAVWGAPVAAEGDAERAVRAALEVVDSVAALGSELGAPDLAARAGVVTGEVAVTVGAQSEGMVAGDPVNTAARVQTAATPGTVLVDDATRRLAAAAIAFADAGEHTLKGKVEPQQLWQATRVLSLRGGVQRIDGLEAPLIGRGPELRTIKDLFHAAIQRRSPRLAVATGDPGVGKSRLGWEFEKYIDGLANDVYWHRGRCLSYGDGVAYWALAQAVRQRFAIAEEDAAEIAAAKLWTGVEKMTADPSDQEYLSERLGRLLGVSGADADAVMSKEELFAGWRGFFERLAATDPVVWLIEEAQHADPGLIEFVNHLMDWTRDLPIFVLVLARSEIVETFPGFGVGRNRTMLTVEPLDARAMDDLVEALVPGMPASARAAITTHAQGVPLFAVETIRSLVDRDIVQPIEGAYRLVGELGELAVPDSLHGLLASRLDALPPPIRALAADAAVLGSSFPAEALVAVSDQDEAAVRAGLAELVRREVLHISADPLSPERGSYQFAQQLVRQVAYDTLSRRDRKRRHLAVAEHLRSTFADDGEAVSDVIAQHYRDALDAVPDDSDIGHIREMAVVMAERAGERAATTGASAAATDAFAAAAMLIEESDPRAAAQYWERAAGAAERAGEYQRSVEHAERALALCDPATDSRAAARARVSAGRALYLIGRLDDARRYLDDAMQELRDQPDHETIRALHELATVDVFSASPRAAETVWEAIELAIGLDSDASVLADTFSVAGIWYLTTNRIELCLAMLERSAKLAQQAGDRRAEARALSNIAGAVVITDPRTAIDAGRKAAELSRQLGDAVFLVTATANLASALLLTGGWEEAESRLEQLVDVGGAQDPRIYPYYLLAASLRGDANHAREIAAGPMQRLRDSDAPDEQAMVALADAAVALDDDPRATVEHARTLLTHIDAVGLAGEITVWGWWLGARAARDLGDAAALADLVAVVDAHPVGHVPPALRAEVDLARAYLISDADDPEAAELIDRGVARLRAVPAPYLLAHALLDRGKAADLDEATRIAESLGCRPLLARIAALTNAVS